jgi:predicted aspartyl protease
MAQSRGMFRHFVAAAALSLLWAAPALAAERLIVPFEINELQHMVVDVEINGTGGMTAVLDTAATFPMLDSRAAGKSGVAPPGERARKVQILGLNGVKDYAVVQVGAVKMGNLNLGALDAAYNEDLDVPGAAANVLPSAAFPGDVLEINFEKGLIAMYNGRPDRKKSGVTDALDFETRDGLIFVEIRINGTKGLGLIDTGSNLTYVNSAFAEAAKMRANEEFTQRLQGATGGGENVRVATARKLGIGDFYFSGAEVMVADPFLFESLGLAGEPAMVIGLDYLSLFTVQFDRRRNKMLLTLPEADEQGMTINFNAGNSRIR